MIKFVQPTTKQITKWVNALRSGKFKQGKNQLQIDTKFCCLGVACEIFIPKTLQRVYNQQLEGTGPHSQPCSPAWLKNIDGAFQYKTGVSLSCLNDHTSVATNYVSKSLTFDEIADLLEMVYIHKALE